MPDSVTQLQADPELLAVRLRKRTLLQQKVALIKRFGLAYYRPHADQDAFHRAGTKFRRRMVRSGNRWGKSTAGCAEDCAWVMNERPWLAESDPGRRGGIPQHPIKLLTITTDWDKVDEIFTSQKGESGKVWKFLPSDLVKSTSRNHSGAIDTIELKNGSLWRFDTVKSFMQNPQGSESSDWDAIHVDEPCPKDMWTAVSRGLIDRGGAAWFTFTPLREFWINDMFFPQETGGAPRSDVWALQGNTHDNPFLSKEAIDEFEASLDEGERDCRIRGIPLHLSGLIYKDFKWDVHVLKDTPQGWNGVYTPPANWPRYFFIDPHPQTPHAVLFCTVTPHGTRIYYQDTFLHCSIEDLAAEVRNVHGANRPVWGKMDPLGFINDPITETNMAFELERAGVYVEKATKALAQGILKVQGELKKRTPAGHPVIYFAPTCRRTLWEIQRYCWDEKENKPVDADDHMMENLYRAEISGLRWLDMGAKRSEPIRDAAINAPELTLHDLNYLGKNDDENEKDTRSNCIIPGL